MRKIAIILFITLYSSISTFAQLSQRTNDSSGINVGTRPQKGDMSLMIGLNVDRDSTKNGLASYKINSSIKKGEILNFKYYLTDLLALRGGIRLYKQSFKSSGDIADSSLLNPTSPNNPGWLESHQYREIDREYVLMPGIEKHFSNSNIFDVYVGSDLSFGFLKQDFLNNRLFTNGDYSSYGARQNTTILGLGGVVGFNIFLAHLPVSIGFEYGLNADWFMGGKIRVREDVQTTTGSTVATDQKEYYLQPNDPAGLDPNGNVYKYSKLRRSAVEMDTNQKIRFTVNIYFGSKK